MTFTTAAFDRSSSGGLKPPPTKRLRRVHLHLSYSMTLARLLDTTPSLHGHYPASSLLWGGPRLAGPSVLSASRVHRLCLFPWHGQPGSQVPYESRSRLLNTGHRVVSK